MMDQGKKKDGKERQRGRRRRKGRDEWSPLSGWGCAPCPIILRS